MQDTHNELSHEELKLISDADFFKRKREITHKIEGSFAVLGENISGILQMHVAKTSFGHIKDSTENKPR